MIVAYFTDAILEPVINRAIPKAARSGPKLSVAEAAPLLGVSVFTVRAWIRQRRLPFFRVGRRIVFDREDLEAFLRAHRVEVREPAP